MSSAFGLDIEASGGMVYYEPKDPELSGSKSIMGDGFNFVGNFRAAQDFDEQFGFGAQISQDPILLTRASMDVGFHNDFIDIRAGLFFPLTNQSFVNPGLSANVGVLYGMFFADFVIASTLLQPKAVNDYSQINYEIDAGIMFPHVWLLAFASDKRFTQQVTKTISVLAGWSRFGVAIDVHNEVQTLSFRVDGGYQQIQWREINGSAKPYEDPSYFAGFTFAVVPIDNIRLVVNGRLPVYPMIGDFSLSEISIGLEWAISW
jgi:hypothetical protein